MLAIEFMDAGCHAHLVQVTFSFLEEGPQNHFITARCDDYV
jgi:hypothetical protein